MAQLKDLIVTGASRFLGNIYGNLKGNADTATTSTKLGSSSVGSGVKPIYLNAGTATASSSTVGSSSLPVYMSSGTITQCSTTLGVSITGNSATATKATQDGNGNTISSTYLPLAGGTMTGPIAMGGNKMTGLNTPTATGDAATKGYVDGKRFTKTATITTTWSGSVAPYTQSVNVSGILASDQPHIAPVYSSTFATAVKQKEAWSMVDYAQADNGKITFVCFEDKPTTAIPIQIEVMR